MLNTGDLVQVKDSYCQPPDVFSGGCYCFFCSNNMTNAMGLVTHVWTDEDDDQSAIVEFPCGQNVFRSHEYRNLEVLSRA